MTDRAAPRPVRGGSAGARAAGTGAAGIGAARAAAPGTPASPAAHWIGGLDGLRAVAVIAVVLFHLNPGYLSGGFLGVDLFFAISGYLITRLLLAERARHGAIRLGRFYLRRARRLLPAVLALLVAVGVLAPLLWPDQRPTLPGSVLSSLGYVTNWWMIADQQSYFVAMGRPPMLQHLWSLAIEEQFYLLWAPAVLALTAPWVVRRVLRGRMRPEFSVAVTAGLLALCSTIAMTVIAIRTNVPYQADSSRVYFGTDTHAMGLLVGAAAGALAAVPWRELRRRPPRWVLPAWRASWRRRPLLPTWLVGSDVVDDDGADSARGVDDGHTAENTRPANRGLATARAGSRRGPLPVWVTDAVAVAGLAGLVFAFITVDSFVPGLYRGGFTLFSLVAVVAICTAARRGSRVGSLLDSAPLTWIGRRSYGIYLWHWPILVVTRPEFDLQGPAWLIDTARAGLVLVIAGLSYRYLETPIRERGTVAWCRASGSALVAASRRLAKAARRPVLPGTGAAGAGATAGAVSRSAARTAEGTRAATVGAKVGTSAAAGTLHRRLAPGVAATAVFAVVCAAVLVTAGFATPRTNDAASEPVPATPLPLAPPAPSSAPILTFPSGEGPDTSPTAASSSAPAPLETTRTAGSGSATSDPGHWDSWASTIGPSSPAVTGAETGEGTDSPPMTTPPSDAGPPASATAPSMTSGTAPVLPPPAPPATSASTPPASLATSTAPPPKPVAKPPATTAAAPPKAPAAAMSAFGDSVLLGASPAVKAVVGSLSVDAVVGRQAWDTLKAIAAAQQAKSLAPVVLIHTGNNGVISPKQLAATLASLKDRTHVVLMNDHVDRPWQGPNNKTIAAVGAQYPNVVVVDWNAAAAQHPAWFGPDGIHVNGAGAQAYAALVAQALR